MEEIVSRTSTTSDHTALPSPGTSQRKRSLEEFQEDEGAAVDDHDDEDFSQASNVTVLTERGMEIRIAAFTAALKNTEHGNSALIPLISTGDNHSVAEIDLGRESFW